MTGSERGPSSPAGWQDSRWLVLVPLVLGFLAHAGALDNGFTNWDDPLYLLTNRLTADPFGQGLGALLRTAELGYSIPLTVLVYAAERSAFDLSPAGFHAVSLLLHLVVVALVVLLGRRLGASMFGAAAAAALFAVHPIVVEPVAWVVGQKDLLAAILVLAALCVRAGPRGDRVGPAALAVALAVLSLAAKPNTVAAPLLLFGVDAVRGRRLTARANLAVYALAALAAIAATALAMIGHGAHGASPTAILGLRSLGEAGWAFVVALRNLLAPLELTARYFPPDTVWPWALVGFLAAALVAAGAVVAWRRDHRSMAFGIAAALLAYAPASGLIPLSRGLADSYLYLPLALLAAGFATALGRAVQPRLRAAGAGLAIALALLVLATRAQVEVWRDAPALWAHTAIAYPDRPIALVRLGDAYMFTSRPDLAVEAYERATTLDPELTAHLISLGDALEQLGRVADAEAVLADGVARGGYPVFRDRYGVFLVHHPEIEPSSDQAAHAALVQVAPLLARRGERPAGLARAAALLDRYGEPALAARIRDRLDQLQSPRR